MNNPDIRWKQRFQNLQRSVKYLEDGLSIAQPDMTEKAGIIQFFEICFELSWNVLKDYLTEQGFHDIKSPRDAIKKAFETGLIDDGHLWLEALQNRNKTSHAYDEAMADAVVAAVRNDYTTLLRKLVNKLNPEY
jgi:nucleotidyltransferase substrate binding protein (TIGR01987 family)